MAAQPADLPPLEFRPLAESSRAAFSCGVAEIDRWFKKCAKKHSRLAHRVTTVHFENDPAIIGFYAFSMKLTNERMLTRDEFREWGLRFSVWQKDFICLNFDYLAVASNQQGRGVGTVIMGRVISEFAKVASICGIELMTGSAINEQVGAFYQRLGFIKYGHAKNSPQIFLPAISALEIAF